MRFHTNDVLSQYILTLELHPDRRFVHIMHVVHINVKNSDRCSRPIFEIVSFPTGDLQASANPTQAAVRVATIAQPRPLQAENRNLVPYERSSLPGNRSIIQE